MLGTMLSVFRYSVSSLSLFLFLPALRVRHEIVTVMSLKLREAKDTVPLPQPVRDRVGAECRAF